MGFLSDRLRGKQIYLDANVFIYALEGMTPWVGELADLFTGIDEGGCTAVTSELTLAECLVRPFAIGNDTVVNSYLAALKPRRYLSVVPISKDTLLEAAKLRATQGLKLPDAIHAATAIAEGCSVLVSNDAAFRRLIGVEVILLSKWREGC